MDTDLSLWGVFAMPVGLTLCFGPALFVWIRMELKAESPKKDKNRK
jgi:hypothetical protein